MLTGTRYGTNDLEKAKVFYDEIAKIVGAQRVFERSDLVAYKGPEGGMFLIGKPFEGAATHGNGTQVTMVVKSRAIVDAVYAKALELGGKSEGAPGVRGDDPNGYYGAYFRDLDGNKLTAFRIGPPD